MKTPFKVTLMDIFYLMAIYYFIRAILETTFFRNLVSARIFFIYLIIILIALLYGLHRWDISVALGGLKIFTPMFAIAVPVFIVGKARVNDTRYIARIFKYTVIVSAIGSLILFVIELSYGGRFFFNKTLSVDLGLDRMEDFRGIRYLGSQETYNILLLALLLIYDSFVRKKIKFLGIFISIVLIIIAFFTKNRTAIFSITGVFLLQLLLTRRRFLIVFMSVIVILSYVVVDIINTKITKPFIDPFSSALNLQTDVTGSWRIYCNLAYLREGLKSPILGKGLTSQYAGGVYVEELKDRIQFPPHNMFIIQFFQSGIFATILLLIFTLILTAELVKVTRCLQNEPGLLQSVYLLIAIVSSQLIYGQFYGYIWFFGIYCGFAMLLIKSVHKKAFQRTMLPEQVPADKQIRY